TLRDVLKSRDFSHVELVCIFIDIAEVLMNIHDKGIVHNDLKHNNIVIRDKRNAGQKWIDIVDYGLACRKGEIVGFDLQEDEAPWLAPEVKRGEASFPASDIYSYGALLQPLYDALDENAMIS
ncbi:hypothetical protein SK128_015086, partial [Halocaridina rubra]